LMAVNGGRWGI